MRCSAGSLIIAVLAAQLCLCRFLFPCLSSDLLIVSWSLVRVQLGPLFFFLSIYVPSYLLKQPALPFNAALNRLLQYVVAGAEQGEGFPGPGHGGIDQFTGEYRGESVWHHQGGMHELRALRLVYRHRIHGLDLLQSAG